jgi:membrane protein
VAMDVGKEAKAGKGLAVRAYNKFNNDWTMNLATMVAYNALTSFFPLLLALITLLAIVPSAFGSQDAVIGQINSILPGDMRSQINLSSWITQVNRHSGLLTLISVVGLIWSGSNLFGSLESAFAIIFRVKTRDFLPQKLMSVLMILLFTVLVPLSFVSTFVVSAASSTLSRILPSFFGGWYAVVLGVIGTLASLFALFAAIYTVVPNLPIRWRYAWRGALVAAVAMTVVNNVFPYYTAHFVNTKQYGTAALATAIVGITWFWFFALVALIGAQVNALALGMGYWKHDLTRTLMDQHVPAIGGAATAMDALRQTGDAEVFNTPLGLLRDEPQAEEKDTGRRGAGAKGDTPASSSVRTRGGNSALAESASSSPAPGTAKRGESSSGRVASGVAALSRKALTTLEGNPHAASESTSGMMPTAIATGGVEAKSATAVMGLPAVFRGLVATGALVGLLRGLLGAKRQA